MIRVLEAMKAVRQKVRPWSEVVEYIEDALVGLEGAKSHIFAGESRWRFQHVDRDVDLIPWCSRLPLSGSGRDHSIVQVERKIEARLPEAWSARIQGGWGC